MASSSSLGRVGFIVVEKRVIKVAPVCQGIGLFARQRQNLFKFRRAKSATSFLARASAQTRCASEVVRARAADSASGTFCVFSKAFRISAT